MTAVRTKHPKVSEVPELLALWHPTLNSLDPAKTTTSSQKQVWWKCPAGHEWEGSVKARSLRPWCVPCAADAVPKVSSVPWLMERWHPTLNDGLDPSALTLGSTQIVTWLCSLGHVWTSDVKQAHRAGEGRGCAQCYHLGSRTLSTVEDLPAEWHPSLNDGVTPETIAAASGKKVWWRCLKDPRHEWEAPVYRVATQGSSCLKCRYMGEDTVATTPHLLAEWDPSNEVDPRDVSTGSRLRVRWICSASSEHAPWDSIVNSRRSGSGCPACARTARGSLGDHPLLSKEWDEELNGCSASSIPPFHMQPRWWRCSLDSSHSWKATPSARSGDLATGCPHCVGMSHSKEELLLSYELALFMPVALGEHRLDLVDGGRVLDVDILVPDIRLVLEFDSARYHSGRSAQDETKSLRLRTAGWRLVRARETPLPLNHPDDVLVLPGGNKRRANAVLLHLRDQVGIALPGVDEYVAERRLRNREAALEAYQSLQARRALARSIISQPEASLLAYPQNEKTPDA